MSETEDKKIQTVPSIKVEEDYSVTIVNKAAKEIIKAIAGKLKTST